LELSVIILSYNVRPYVWQCIDSVLAATQGIKAEIILVDNASEDGTIELIGEDFPQVKLLPNTENIGFAKAYNQAVNQAQGAYLCILNPDTVVGEDVFKSILKQIKGQDHFGAVGTRFIDGRGCFLPECKRVVPTPLGSLRKLLGLGGQKGVYYQDDLGPEQQGPVSILAGAFLFLKRSDYLSIGGFDEHYFMFGEDIDFSYKLLKKGKTNYYFGQKTILHYKGESTQKNRRYLERFYGAMVHFYKTHFSDSAVKVFTVSVLAQMLIWWRSFWPKGNNQIVNAPDVVIWVSQGTSPSDLLAGWLRKKALSTKDGDFCRQSPEVLLKSAPSNALVVFDRSSLSYDQIIELMLQGSLYGQAFRIWHQDKSLLIGSDSSDAQGEALILGSE
jgi:GT2 family glycosyltransferase